jgi:hypothetical protein
MDTRPAPAAAVAVLACALALGGGMQIAEPLLGLPNSVSALGAPWLVCAFAVGALAARVPAGAAAGAALLVAGTGLYYAALVYGYGGSELRYAVTMTLVWGAAAALGGAGMGALGAAWRDATGTRAVLLAALPAAALAGEAVLLLLSWDEGAGALAAELLMAAALLCLLSRRRVPLPAAALAATVLAVVFAGAEAEIRDVMRAAGWHGA